MSILLSKDLPAAAVLRAEGYAVEEREGDPSVLRIALLNLMPAKEATELQFARLLAGTPYPVELTLLLPDGYAGRHADPAHLDRHYRRWSEVKACAAGAFDGLIVTGAPLETLPFEAVSWWPEMIEILDWAETRVGASLFVCWAAQAALYRRHRVAKRLLPEKRFGLYAQETVSRLAQPLAGLPARFALPVSRHTEVREQDLPWGRGLSVSVRSPDSGLCLVADGPRRSLYLFDHLEYDADSLAREYRRDLAAGRSVPLPHDYFCDDDPGRPPLQIWRGAARGFYAGWTAALDRRRRRLLRRLAA